MPIPIQPVNSKDSVPQENVDYSFLKQYIPDVNLTTAGFNIVSNKDAENLMKIWLQGDKKENFEFDLQNNIIASTDLSRLKINGLVQSSGSKCKITDKGRKVITTMTLSESNQFLRVKKEKKYTEIMASMNKRGKKGYRIAFNDGTIDISK
jgi:hypothetical protein